MARAGLLDRADDLLSAARGLPRRHNVGRALRDSVQAAMETADLDPSVRKVVVTGSGPSFRGGGVVGGTVRIPRRIGSRRTVDLALADRPVDLDTALWWGLVDARV